MKKFNIIKIKIKLLIISFKGAIRFSIKLIILKKNPTIAVLGLNPHCETIDKFSEEEKIIYPAIKYLKNSGVKICFANKCIVDVNMVTSYLYP